VGAAANQIAIRGHIVNTSNAEKKIDEGVDPFDRSIQIKTVPIDETYPEYILNNKEKYAQYIKPWN
jgi:hypothetical protein